MSRGSVNLLTLDVVDGVVDTRSKVGVVSGGWYLCKYGVVSGLMARFMNGQSVYIFF